MKKTLKEMTSEVGIKNTHTIGDRDTDRQTDRFSLHKELQRKAKENRKRETCATEGSIDDDRVVKND